MLESFTNVNREEEIEKSAAIFIISVQQVVALGMKKSAEN